MKKILAFVLPALFALSLGVSAQAAAPTGGVADVLRMAAAGVGDEVLLSYVQGAPTSFPLTVDQIIELKNAKVGATVIQAMISHVPTTQAPPPAAAATSAPTPSPDPNLMPAPLAEYVPFAPGPGYRWVPGYWTWAGSWVWVSGQWTPYVFFYARPYPRPFFHHW